MRKTEAHRRSRCDVWCERETTQNRNRREAARAIARYTALESRKNPPGVWVGRPNAFISGGRVSISTGIARARGDPYNFLEMR